MPRKGRMRIALRRAAPRRKGVSLWIGKSFSGWPAGWEWGAGSAPPAASPAFPPGQVNRHRAAANAPDVHEGAIVEARQRGADVGRLDVAEIRSQALWNDVVGGGAARSGGSRRTRPPSVRVDPEMAEQRLVDLGSGEVVAGSEIRLGVLERGSNSLSKVSC